MKFITDLSAISFVFVLVDILRHWKRKAIRFTLLTVLFIYLFFFVFLKSSVSLREVFRDNRVPVLI